MLENIENWDAETTYTHIVLPVSKDSTSIFYIIQFHGCFKIGDFYVYKKKMRVPKLEEKHPCYASKNCGAINIHYHQTSISGI